jgi:ElaB/YqjD/DUF883 family membrane-anchored ribosome-binding protein
MDIIDRRFWQIITAKLQKLNLDHAQMQQRLQDILEKVPELVSSSAEALLKALKSKAPSMLRRRRSAMHGFERRTYRRWRKAIDLLETLSAISQEAGDHFNATFRPQASKENDVAFDVLTRLHARACQIASEILSLLRSGYADGAHARWRTLHEVAVTALFVSKHGKEVANRYFLHEAVESYKAAIEYQTYCNRLGEPPYSDQDIAGFKANRDQICDQFGPSFKNRYGWACEALGKSNPTFSELEQDVELGHLRPYYRMASHNVHSNPKGITFRLGTVEVREEILLAGPSDAGFAEPGHGCAVSLQQVNVSLLKTKPNVDRLIILKAMQDLVAQIGEAFLEADSAGKQRRRTGR